MLVTLEMCPKRHMAPLSNLSGNVLNDVLSEVCYPSLSLCNIKVTLSYLRLGVDPTLAEHLGLSTPFALNPQVSTASAFQWAIP